MNSLAMIASLACPLLLLVTFGYVAVCSGSPFGPCRRCKGTGRLGTRLRRPCPRCGGTGRHIRTGRHLVNEITRLYRDGTR